MADSEDVLDLVDDEVLLDTEALPEDATTEQPVEGDEDEAEITFDGEAAPASGESDSSGLVKHLREQIRERDKRLAAVTKTPAPVVVGPKPDLWEDCDGDVDKYDEAKAAWDNAKAQAATQESEQTRTQREFQETVNAELTAYKTGLSKLPYADKQDAEDTVVMALTDVQQLALVRAADNPAKVVYALGKSPAKLAELAAITDPLKLAVAVAKLEGKIQVTSKRNAPAPERIASGNAGTAPRNADKELERLEREAERSGDRTAVIAHRRKMNSGA